MSKFLILIALLSVAGCKTIPEFPVVWFWSNGDLLIQTQEIESSLRID